MLSHDYKMTSRDQPVPGPYRTHYMHTESWLKLLSLPKGKSRDVYTMESYLVACALAGAVHPFMCRLRILYL